MDSYESGMGCILLSILLIISLLVICIYLQIQALGSSSN